MSERRGASYVRIESNNSEEEKEREEREEGEERERESVQTYRGLATAATMARA